MHILYNIAGFYRPAGMERVLCDKANWLVEHGHRVTILTTEQQGRPYAFPLDSRVVVIDLAIGYEDNNGGSLWDKLVHYPGKQRIYEASCHRRARKLFDRIMTEGNFRRANHFKRRKPKGTVGKKLHSFIGIFVNFFQLADIFPGQAFRGACTALKKGFQKNFQKK